MNTLQYTTSSHIMELKRSSDMERNCCVCKVIKDLNDFPKDKQSSLGYSYRCKECNRKRHKEYSKRMPEEVRERKRKARNEYGKENRLHLNKKMREDYQNNPEKYRARNKKFRKENKEKFNEYMRNYRENNMEKILAQAKVKYHVDNENIVRPDNCSICKSSDYRIEAHHFEYSKPLDVLWVCQKCHLALHQRINEESKISADAERLNETASVKEDATVCSTEETCRGRAEELSPPFLGLSNDGQ